MIKPISGNQGNIPFKPEPHDSNKKISDTAKVSHKGDISSHKTDSIQQKNLGSVNDYVAPLEDDLTHLSASLQELADSPDPQSLINDPAFQQEVMYELYHKGPPEGGIDYDYKCLESYLYSTGHSDQANEVMNSMAFYTQQVTDYSTTPPTTLSLQDIAMEDINDPAQATVELTEYLTVLTQTPGALDDMIAQINNAETTLEEMFPT